METVLSIVPIFISPFFIFNKSHGSQLYLDILFWCRFSGSPREVDLHGGHGGVLGSRESDVRYV